MKAQSSTFPLRTIQNGAANGKGDQMAFPGAMPVKRRLQILDDEGRMKAAMESLENENHSLKALVVQLSTLVIRGVADKK
jgi:hypothetical protein